MTSADEGAWALEGAPPAAGPVIGERGLQVPRHSVSARWDQVFGALIEGDKVVVLLARRPPAPPWVELLPKDIEPLKAEVFVADLERRLDQRSYREMGRRPTLPVDVFFKRVLAGTAIPGALEIPIGPGPGGGSRAIGVLAGGGAVALGAAFSGPIGALGAAILAGGVAFVRFRRPLRGRRVLVLAPDGCVVGLPSGVRPFGWDEIAGFRIGSQANRPALEIEGRDEARLGMLDSTWFDAPLSRVVAVAESYRRRRS